MTIQLADLLAPAYHAMFWDVYEGKHEEYWLSGGRGSGKSSFVSLVLICLMLRDPKANVMVYRKVADTLRESVYPQMRWAMERLGVADYFTFRLSPLEIIYKPTGQKVMFRGADDPEKSKGVKLSKGYFAALWFEETSAFYGMEEIRTIQASILRGEKGITLCSYNPPISAQNWVNQEILTAHQGRKVHHSDYRDMPKEWLGKTFIDQAETLRKHNDRAYRHMYLGEAVGTGGKVFHNVCIRPITAEEKQTFGHCYYGLDFGFASDPDALIGCYLHPKNKTLYLFCEHVRVGESLQALSQACLAITNGQLLRCDSASPREIAELRRLGVDAIGVKKGAGSVGHGIRWLQELKQIIVDPKTCPHMAKELECYEYARDKQGAFLSECPDKNNHTIDAIRYALEPIITKRVVRLRKTNIQP